MILMVLLGLGLVATSPVFAKDDGGFGDKRFTSSTPASLAPFKRDDIMSMATDENPAEIEPASGIEENSSTKNNPSKDGMVYDRHETKTIIKKDMTVR